MTPITDRGRARRPAPGFTGEWEVTVGSDSSPFIVVIDGVNAKAWDKEDKADGRGLAAERGRRRRQRTVTANDNDLSFAARRR